MQFVVRTEKEEKQVTVVTTVFTNMCCTVLYSRLPDSTSHCYRSTDAWYYYMVRYCTTVLYSTV